MRQAIPTQGNSKPDWVIICDLAKRMGFATHFDFATPKEIWNEVRRVWKAGAGISYERIEKSGLQWPCTSEDHPGTTILHSQSFPMGERASFSQIEYRPTKEQISDEYPFLLNTGRALYQFNAGTMTMRTANVVLHPTDFLDISPSDAAAIDLKDGDWVRLTSKFGSTVIPVRISDGIRQGELFSTFHDPKVFTNRVTGSNRDNVVSTPGYKVTAVRVEKI